MLLPSEPFRERDSCLCFGGGGSVTRTVGTGLNDMHHTASTLRITADIERVCSHQNPAHRLYSRIKLNLCHRVRQSVRIGLYRSAKQTGDRCLRSPQKLKFSGTLYAE